jgi:hypothetical protein
VAPLAVGRMRVRVCVCACDVALPVLSGYGVWGACARVCAAWAACCVRMRGWWRWRHFVAVSEGERDKALQELLLTVLAFGVLAARSFLGVCCAAALSSERSSLRDYSLYGDVRQLRAFFLGVSARLSLLASPRGRRPPSCGCGGPARSPAHCARPRRAALGARALVPPPATSDPKKGQKREKGNEK